MQGLMKVAIVLLLVVVLFSLGDAHKTYRRKELNPFRDPTPAQRAKELLQKMTLSDKLLMVHGSPGPYVGDVPAIPRLNIPALHLEDGPQGVADDVNLVTAWPSALTAVATWDVDLMHQYAMGLAEEQLTKGTNVMLGPMVNIARVPYGGRNFESFGEDPHLAAEMAAAEITGVQKKGVIATVKHFVDNNQEHDRTTVSENVPERAQWEIYYPAFQAAVDVGVGAAMCSYNKINNTYACENPTTLGDFRGKMGFKGWMMSDWGATHSTVQSALAGLDQQMPDDSFFGQALANAIAKGQVPQSRLDDMVLRILTAMFAMGIFDRPQTGNLNDNAQTPAHTKLARKVATNANVLLKNDGNLLPLNIAKLHNITIVGNDAFVDPIATGGGSGHVNAPYIVTPLAAIGARVAGTKITVHYESNNTAKAQALAKTTDVAIVFVATFSSEGSDRPTLLLSSADNALVQAVRQVQPKTIVVIHTPGSVVLPWANTIPAIIAAFYPGQEDGNAIAPILFGDVNPSGKLPLTWPRTEAEIPVNTPQQYPGINDQADYSENLLVGYRWYDAKNVPPAFEFGRGLSYTTFSYSNLVIAGSVSSGYSIKFQLKNSGLVDGAEVPQLYLGFPASAGEPPKVLRAFEKFYLSAGQSREVSFHLSSHDLSIWSVQLHDWQLIRGSFNVYVGSSSRDIRLTGTLIA